LEILVYNCEVSKTTKFYNLRDKANKYQIIDTFKTLSRYITDSSKSLHRKALQEKNLKSLTQTQNDSENCNKK
jgi:hypothetical protein